MRRREFALSDQDVEVRISRNVANHNRQPTMYARQNPSITYATQWNTPIGEILPARLLAGTQVCTVVESCPDVGH